MQVLNIKTTKKHVSFQQVCSACKLSIFRNDVIYYMTITWRVGAQTTRQSHKQLCRACYVEVQNEVPVRA